jgi:hypothetical protein
MVGWVIIVPFLMNSKERRKAERAMKARERAEAKAKAKARTETEPPSKTTRKQPENTREATRGTPPKRKWRNPLGLAKRAWIGFARQTWNWVLAGATLLGLYILWPKVSIEPYASVDPHDPFGQMLFVKNESVYPIYRVIPECGIDKVQSQQRTVPDLENFALLSTADIVPKLSADERTTFKCPIASTNVTFRTIKLEPYVVFELPFGIRQCRFRNFESVPAKDGSYLWIWKGGGSCPWRGPNIGN